MSVLTALLLVGALGIMLAMHFVGHGGHRGSHDADETDGAEVTTSASPADEPAGNKPKRTGHGCCG